MDVLQTHYARSGDVSIAYHVFGKGELDVVVVLPGMSHIENIGVPDYRGAAFERLGSFSRVIVFDKRGTGMSDPVPGTPPLEMRTDDVRAVMDAVGSTRAAMIGIGDGGPMSLLFAVEVVLAELESFFRAATQAGELEPDTVLATVLFTDIVASTAKAIELGDRRWAELVATHHERVRRGRELNTADEVRVSTTVRDLVAGSGIEFADCGLHTLKGMPEKRRAYAVA